MGESRGRLPAPIKAWEGSLLGMGAQEWEAKQAFFCLVIDNTVFLLMDSSCPPQDHTEMTKPAVTPVNPLK